jgi:hypothetical protein
MSVQDALKMARIAGIVFKPVGNDLLLDAEKPPPPAVLDALKHHKRDIIALLRPDTKKWKPEDWQNFYNERVTFLKQERNLTRQDAEQQAYEATVIQWLNVTSPQNLDENYCAQCGQPVGRIGRDAVPFLTGGDGYAWLHHDCHPTWLTRRRKEAVKALQDIGIVYHSTGGINHD